MKFIQRGALRVESMGRRSRNLGHVTFLNPDGGVVLVVANAGGQETRFVVRSRGRQFETGLSGRSVATFRWTPPGQE